MLDQLIEEGRALKDKFEVVYSVPTLSGDAFGACYSIWECFFHCRYASFDRAIKTPLVTVHPLGIRTPWATKVERPHETEMQSSMACSVNS